MEDKSIVSFVPACVKAGKWTGTVGLKLLAFDEFYGAMAKIRVSQEKGEGYYRQAKADLASHFVTVDLKRVSDGRECKSLADLDYGRDCHMIIAECLDFLLHGDEEQGNS